jgi:hypothetical protein
VNGLLIAVTTYIGTLLCGVPPSRSTVHGCAFLTICAFGLINFVRYEVLFVGGVRYAHYVPFLRFLLVALTSQNDVSPLDIDLQKLLLRLGSFFVSSIIVWYAVLSTEICRQCGHKVTSTSTTRKFSKAEEFIAFYVRFAHARRTHRRSCEYLPRRMVLLMVALESDGTHLRVAVADPKRSLSQS